jgi:hypothetical protein
LLPALRQGVAKFLDGSFKMTDPKQDPRTISEIEKSVREAELRSCIAIAEYGYKCAEAGISIEAMSEKVREIVRKNE